MRCAPALGGRRRVARPPRARGPRARSSTHTRSRRGARRRVPRPAGDHGPRRVRPLLIVQRATVPSSHGSVRRGAAASIAFWALSAAALGTLVGVAGGAAGTVGAILVALLPCAVALVVRPD